MDTLIRRLASPPATSTSTLAITWLFFVMSTSAVMFFTSTNATSLYLLVSAALSAAIFGAIGLCRAPLGRLADYRVRAAAVLAVVIVANLERILALDELGLLLEVTGTRTLLARSASAVSITLMGMLIVGEITARRERFHAVVAALTARSADLSLEVISYSDRLTQATAELQASIRTILDPALSIVAREVRPESTTLSTLTSARVIEETLRVSVRPIIDALAEPTDTTPRAAAALAPVTPPATPHARHSTIDIHDSIRPVLGVAPLRIIAIPFIIAILPFGPALRALIILTLTWPLLSAIRRLWPARFRILPTGRAVVALTLTYLVAVSLPLLLFLVVSRPAMNETLDAQKIAALQLWAITFFVANAWFASFVFILERSRRLTAERLTEVGEQIELSIGRMRQQIWYARRTLIWVLHGPLQSALVSAALRLESDVAISPAERIVIHDNITGAYAQLNTGSLSHPHFTRFITDLTRMWSRICEITFRDPDNVLPRLDTDPASTASLIEITTESVCNAIRHGKATSINVTVSDTKIGLITLLVTDNGTGPPPHPEPGIGSDLYASLTHEWALTGSAAGTTLTAHVPWTQQGPKPT